MEETKRMSTFAKWYFALLIGAAVLSAMAMRLPGLDMRPVIEEPASPDGTTVAPLPRNFSAERDSIVATEARRAGVPADLAIAVSHVENWTGDSMAVSSAGAVGIMQVMPKYWQDAFPEACGAGSLFERRRNACVGVRVLGLYLAKHTRADLALRAYNGALTYREAGDRYVADVLDRMVRRAD